MANFAKPAEAITQADFRSFPVWEFVNAEPDPTGTAMRPSTETLPLRSTLSCAVGAEVKLARGDIIDAAFWNISPKRAASMKHFLSLTLFVNGARFDLARYHDPDFSQHGPEGLAKWLGMSIEEVFPITYDLTSKVVGDPSVLSGEIVSNVEERLSPDQLIDLALED